MKGYKRYDKNIICLPRHVSFTINQTFAKWGKAEHKLPETLINTTVSTTKVKEGIKLNKQSLFVSNNLLLTVRYLILFIKKYCISYMRKL